MVLDFMTFFDRASCWCCGNKNKKRIRQYAYLFAKLLLGLY